MDLIYSVLHAMRHLVSDVSLYCVGKVSYTQHMPCATLTESGGELLSCVCVCVVVQQWLAAGSASVLFSLSIFMCLLMLGERRLARFFF